MKAGVFLVEGNVGGLDGQLASRGHGVTRVHGEIHDDLLDLSGIGPHRAQTSCRDHDQVDVFADHASEHLQVFGDHAIQIKNLRRQHLLAAEGQELAGERCRAPRCAGNFLRRAAQRRVRAEAVKQKFRIARDHHQQIVEIVRDAAGESAYGFHLLRLPELLLQGAALGDIFGKQFEGWSLAAVGNSAAGNADHRGRAVFAFPFGDQPVEGSRRAQIIRQLEPLQRIGVEGSEMFPDQFLC